VSPAAIARLWRRIPVLVRAVIAGFVILMVGEGVPSNLFFINRSLWPSVPWFALPAVLWLWMFWQYLSGRWWPRSTSDARRQNLGAAPLSPAAWRWALVAVGSMMMSLGALHFMTARFDPLDYRGFYALFTAVPPQTVAALILVISTAAGIVEEAAFRGYMQRMIERRHGPVMATIVVAICFCLVHIKSIPPLTPTRTLFIFADSIIYSVVARASGSILPGLVLHAAGDAAGVFLLWWLWSHDGLRADAPAWLYLIESAILAAIGVWAYRRLIHSYREDDQTG
jgi:membrane protease YdiL (CAAX protease family)